MLRPARHPALATPVKNVPLPISFPHDLPLAGFDCLGAQHSSAQMAGLINKCVAAWRKNGQHLGSALGSTPSILCFSKSVLVRIFPPHNHAQVPFQGEGV